MPENTPHFSLIIPAHNEEKRLPGTLEQVFSFLEQQKFTYEVIVVENGSTDQTLRIAQAHASRQPALRVIHSDERGKGLAVRLGMLEARGEYRMFADADFSMPVSEISRFLPPASHADISIASREARGAVRYNEPFRRHLSGRVFNTLIRMLVLPDIQDTQCGFKCFSAAAAQDLFPRQTMPGWSFDVEILYIARRKGYKIHEIGIPWFYNADSKVSLVHDSLRMARDLLIIRRNGTRGMYER